MKQSTVLGVVTGVVLGVVGMAVVNSVVPVEARCADKPCDTPPCCNGDVNGDAVIDISDAISILSYLFAGGPEPREITCGPVMVRGSLPATGQTQCYSGAQPIVIDCASTEFPGQDGFYQRGCPMRDRFVDNGDGTVTDNCTGLTWQQTTADINRDGRITFFSDRVPWEEALRYCEDLELGGKTDWRLPNVRELQSIVDYGRADPAISPVFSVDVDSLRFWTSSSRVLNPFRAWQVDLRFGVVYGDSKRSESYVLAVRG